VKLFTFHHGNSSLQGLQGVGSALQNAAASAAQVRDQAIRAKYAQARLAEQQQALSKQVSQTLAQDEQQKQLEAERLATADIAGMVIRGEDLSTVSPDRIRQAFSAMDPNTVTSLTQVASKQAEARQRAREQLIKEGRQTSLFQAAKNGFINPDEVAIASKIAEDTGDDSMLKALEQKSNAYQERVSEVSRTKATLTALKNSPTFMGELDRRQYQAFQRAEDMLSSMENGNVLDDQKYSEVQNLIMEARTPTDVLDERNRLRSQVEEQQWLLNRYQEKQMGLPMVTDSLGNPVGAPSGLAGRFGEGSSVPQSFPAGPNGVPPSEFSGKSIRHYSQIPQERQVEVSNGMRQFALDVIDEAGLPASEIDPEVMMGALQGLARDVYKVDIPASQLMDFAYRANGQRGGAAGYGQEPVQYSTDPRAAAMREMRKVIRAEDGSPVEIARKLGIKLQDMQVVANNPQDLPADWKFDPLPGEEQRGVDDANIPIPPGLPGLLEITQGGFKPNLDQPGFSRDLSAGNNEAPPIDEIARRVGRKAKEIFSKPGRRPGDPRRNKK